MLCWLDECTLADDFLLSSAEDFDLSSCLVSTMTPESYPIIEVSAAQVAWQNRLIGTSRIISVRIDDSPVELSFERSSVVESEFYLNLEINDASTWIGFDDWSALPGVDDFLDGVSLSSLPDGMISVALEAILAKNLASWKQAFNRFQIGDVSRTPENFPNNSVGFALKTATERTIQGTIYGEEDSLQKLSEIVRSVPASAALKTESLILRSRIELGQSRIPIDVLQQVKLHDVLIVEDSSWTPDDQIGVIRFSPAFAWQVSIQDAIATCVETVAEDDMSEKQPGSEICVDVVVSRGFVECSVGDLTLIGPDHEFEIQDSEIVLIRANETVLARGEMVLVGEQLGVRLIDSPSELPEKTEITADFATASDESGDE